MTPYTLLCSCTGPRGLCLGLVGGHAQRSSHGPEEWLLASCGRTNVLLPHFFFSLSDSVFTPTLLHMSSPCPSACPRLLPLPLVGFNRLRAVSKSLLPKSIVVKRSLVQDDGILSDTRSRSSSSFTPPMSQCYFLSVGKHKRRSSAETPSLFSARNVVFVAGKVDDLNCQAL